MNGARPTHLVSRLLARNETQEFQHLRYADRRTNCLKIKTGHLLLPSPQLTIWSHVAEKRNP